MSPTRATRPHPTRRRAGALVIAAALVALATSCYQPLDFTADHKADRYTFDFVGGDWWDPATGTPVLDAQTGDLPVPADWDGNHLWDKAVVRPNGDWVTGSSLGTISFPKPAQLPAFVAETGSKYHILPVPGDYDGDGSVEPAWYRDSDATWFIEGTAPISFGTGPSLRYAGPANPPMHFPDQDFPVPADYDGDGTTDLGTFNARSMAWSVRSSADGSTSTVRMQHNAGLSWPAPADYDGVGHAQRATSGWEGVDIEGHALVPLARDQNYPAVADHDGDNKADLSYLTGDGVWHTVGSTEVVRLGPLFGSSARFPLATGANLWINIARLTYVGQCVFTPSSCPPLA